MMFLALSLTLFASAVFLFRKTHYSAVWTTVFCILVLCSFVLYMFYGVSDYFTGDGITGATMYHVQYGLGGSGFSEYWQLIVVTGFALMLCCAFLYWVLHGIVRNREERHGYTYAGVFVMLVSVVLNPASVDLFAYAQPVQPVSAIESLDAAGDTQEVVGEERVLKKPRGYSFQELYRQPSIASVSENKNVVFLYVEQLEHTYSNPDIFPGLTPGLDSLTSRATYFTDIRQTDGSDFTIAGMVSGQCGVPLYSPSHGNSMSGMDQFLPSARCLGDLLHAKKYHLAYYGGADLDFAGKGKFYTSHRFDEVKGSAELLPLLEDPTYKTSWGLYDDSLFDLSYNRFVELSEQKKPFGLMMLTLDTHHPKGHPSKQCDGMVYGDGKNDILNSVACSDMLVTEFVEKIIDSPYGDNTVVVIASDHLALNNTASDILKNTERRNRLMIIDPSSHVERRVSRTGSTLDIGATLLPFLGFEGDVGLGRNLLDTSESDEEIVYIQNNVRSWKESIARFWALPRITRDVVIDPGTQTLLIGDRSFRVPALVELDSYLNTSIKFQFDTLSKANLYEQVQMLGTDTPYLLIHRCAHLNGIYGDIGDTGYCLVAGRGEQVSVRVLEGETRYSAEEVKELTYF